MTGTKYRSAYLKRVLKDGAWTDLWTVNDDPEQRSWNASIDYVDAREAGSPPPRITCVECGKYDCLGWSEPKRSQLQASSLCFGCDFWYQWMKQAVTNPLMFVCDGSAYTICDERGGSSFSGFGGAPFVVEWPDGRRVATTNLWTQGIVPDRFRERMPDTARWRHGRLLEQVEA